MLLPLLFAIVLHVITKNAGRGVIIEVLYSDNLILMSETMEDLKVSTWIERNHLKIKV